MHAVTLCLVLLALACGASLLARFIKLPLPFIQIAIGVLAGLPPINLQLTLDPQIFLLLFLPPLLFSDGWTLSYRESQKWRWPIFSLSVGLVLFTVVIGGYALHWLIPEMPLSVAFAVAAVVSPTDAVAASAITAHVRLPHRLKHLLESEALLNDASGLVAMRFAVAATLSGGFSPLAASGTFLLVATGGLAIGCVLTLAYGYVHRHFLVRPHDAALQTVLTGLLPFLAFGVAEELGLSGILAAVAAGMTASRLSLIERAHFSARIQTGLTWNVVSFCLNGTIFVLFGLQLPDIFGAGAAGIDLVTSTARLPILGEIAALTALLIVLRFVWVLSSDGLAWVLRQRRRLDGWRVIAASSIAGVRGAVTLAGVLSIPLLLPDGSPFPSRDLAITLATGVILCSMLIAALGVPLLLRGLPADDQRAQNEAQTARVAALEAAIGTVSAGTPPPGSREAGVIAIYREHLASLGRSAGGKDAGDQPDTWRALHRTALHAERQAVQALRGRGEISDVVARQLLGELDFIEAGAMYRPHRLPHLGDGDRMLPPD